MKPAQNAALASQEAAPMAGSKRATSTDRDTRLKVLKKMLTKQEKLVKAKRRRDCRANARIPSSTRNHRSTI
jgi:hypothetical protein